MDEQAVAINIEERLEMNSREESGSVWNDLFGDGGIPSMREFEDYFGDQDPFEFL